MAKVIRMGQLGKALDEILKDAQKEDMKALNSALKKTYIDRLNAVILDTPVDTGTLRNSWFLDTSFNSSRLGKPGNQQRDYIATKLGNDDLVKGQWYFYNNQPYAYRIEYDGYSDQAPRGMLRRNLISFGRRLKQFWKKERGNI